MKRRSALSVTSSEEQQTEISIYDVPTVTLEARELAYQIQAQPGRAHEFSSQIIEKLSLAIRAMGREDVGLVSSTGKTDLPAMGSATENLPVLVEEELPAAG